MIRNICGKLILLVGIVVMISCGNNGEASPEIIMKAPQLVLDTMQIDSLERSRIVRILLPSNYENTKERYPVLYMMDGQNLFQDMTSYAGEWHVDETLDVLVNDGLPQAIVVGVDNGGEHRLQEYNAYDHDRYGKGEGKVFVQWMIETLKPRIDSMYRTSVVPADTWIIGSSFGGIIAFYATAVYPNVFTKAGLLSPSFWASEEYYELAENISSDVRIYMSAGEKEGEQMVNSLDEMAQKLISNGFPADHLYHEIIPGGEHNENLWTGEFSKLYQWMVKE